MANKGFSVDTPKGTIEAKVSPYGEGNGEFPGIWIAVNGADLVLVEYDQSVGKHVIRVWDPEDPDKDPEFKRTIPEEAESDE